MTTHREALEAAAKSLETIALMAGRDEFMQDMDQVRGYAVSRAAVARGALALWRVQDRPARTPEVRSLSGQKGKA